MISYLNLLRVFGNEEAHREKGASTQKRFPPQIVDQDLIVCLLTIGRVLEFWFDCLSRDVIDTM